MFLSISFDYFFGSNGKVICCPDGEGFHGGIEVFATGCKPCPRGTFQGAKNYDGIWCQTYPAGTTHDELSIHLIVQFLTISLNHDLVVNWYQL